MVVLAAVKLPKAVAVAVVVVLVAVVVVEVGKKGCALGLGTLGSEQNSKYQWRTPRA